MKACVAALFFQDQSTNTYSHSADLEGWEWDYDAQAWQPEPVWQQFVDYWADSSRPKMSSVSETVFDLVPCSSVVQNATTREILVRGFYDDIYKRVHLNRQVSKGGEIFLTGQPGTGTRSFL